MTTSVAALMVMALVCGGMSTPDDRSASLSGTACAQIGDSVGRLSCFDQAFPQDAGAGSPNTDAASLTTPSSSAASQAH